MAVVRTRPILIAGFWGYAEATVFFIVPDVFLTLLALKGFRTAYVPILAALLGAALGGMTLYFAGPGLHPLLDGIPGITSRLVEDAERTLERDGIPGMLIGSFRGVPYKLYAAQAAEVGFSPLQFFFGSLFARAPRFLITACLAASAARLLRSYKPAFPLWIAWAVIWVVNYILYFSLIGY